MTAAGRIGGLPPFAPFALEQWQSEHEQNVDINIADSGVRPLTIRELLELAGDPSGFLDVELHYPEVNGSRRLRTLIAGLYDGVSADQVLVTVGGAEANAIAVETLVRPGDEVVVMSPSYAQVEGLARNRGAVVRTFALDPDRAWALDLEAFAAAVTPETRLVALTNPNNPTGHVMSAAELDAVVDIVRAAGCWLLADEVYRGSEIDTDLETPTLLGRYERVVSVNSLSKAYGLSGLRVGWIVAPAELITELWRRHEYATISTSSPAMHLAELALDADVRGRLLQRNRTLIRSTAAVLRTWVDANDDVVGLVSPKATALAFVRLQTGEPSRSFAERLRVGASVLVAPGDCFGLDDHVRITHGLAPERLDDALDRIAATLRAPLASGRC